MTKVCYTCNVEKSLTDYYSNGQGYLLRKCKKCQIALNAKRRKENPEKYKDVDLKQCFGITLAQYNELFSRQQGNCALCQAHQSSLKRALAVDHCHKTGKIRGLLCQRCNLGIGQLEDSTDLLQKAINYLNSFSAEKKAGVLQLVVRKKG